MFCTNCGTNIHDDDSFCTSCGFKEPVSSSNTPLPLPHTIARKRKRTTSVSQGVVIGILLVTIAVFLIGGFFTYDFLFNNSGNKNDFPGSDIQQTISPDITPPPNSTPIRTLPPETPTPPPEPPESDPTVVYIEMPNLIDLHWVEARNRLGNLNRDLDVRTIPVEDDTKTENLVFETTPRFGELVSRGNIIEVKYAVPAAERTVLIPENLVGRTRSVVEQSIRDLDIIVDWSEDYDEVIAAGSIAFVQRAGEKIQAGSIIQIIVSKGPPS